MFKHKQVGLCTILTWPWQLRAELNRFKQVDIHGSFHLTLMTKPYIWQLAVRLLKSLLVAHKPGYKTAICSVPSSKYIRHCLVYTKIQYFTVANCGLLDFLP